MDGSLARAALPDDGQRERLTLARKWAYLLSQTSYFPASHAELEQRLVVLVGELVDLVRGEPFNADPAGAIGTQLVLWRCTDPASLRRTVTVLSKGLLGLAELRPVVDRAERIVTVLVSLAAGFTEQMREFVIGQQESMSKALRRAVYNAEANLRDSEARFNQVTTTSPSGIAITDLDGNFLRVNDALRRILAYPGEDLDRRCVYDVVPPERTDQLLALYANLGAGHENPPRQMLRLRRDDGSSATVSLAASPLLDAEGAPSRAVLVIEDISELTLLQDELCRQALHDVLTGLPNRQYFTSRLEEVVHRLGRDNGITLYLLGLDAFTLITAGLGRRVSERLLVHVADRLKSIMDGERAMVARFDGDEFAILVENSPSTPAPALTAERINEELAVPVGIEGTSLAVSASIGIVEGLPADLGPTELLGAAETTLRRAQRSRGRRYELFDPEEDARDRETYRLAAGMAGAWERGDLRVAYQPFVRLRHGSVIARPLSGAHPLRVIARPLSGAHPLRPVGVEPLLRWHRFGHAPLDHDRCVGLAEQTGLTLPLGTWRLTSACATAREQGWDLPLYLGFTANQAANPDLPAAVLRALRENNLDPRKLFLGMPAPALIADGQPLANLMELADAGVGMVATEFGAVPADLVDLEKLPVQAVHLARWRPRREDAGATTVLTALINTVHAAGVLVIVDGIMNQAHQQWWQRVGADIGQGLFYAPVGTPEEVGSFLGVDQ
ncbi:MAG TPA: EAL domain-containing protein [Pseudonocardiaceae bacterium]|nr:EAL domain-containing protein [Pseudonocardiaceae bacterium]